MIRAEDAISVARSLLGTPYSVLDCINLIKRVIRTAPGGISSYNTAGSNSLWKSYNSSAKYKDLTWRQEGISGAKAGMLAFKNSGENVHHVGLVTDAGTVIHSSSAKGQVVETKLDKSWTLLAVHRYIMTSLDNVGTWKEEEETNMATLYQARVEVSTYLRIRNRPVDGKEIGQLHDGDIVDVLTDGDWPRIRCGETIGYVSKQYLTELEPEQHPDESHLDHATEPQFTDLVRDDGVRIRLEGNWLVDESID